MFGGEGGLERLSLNRRSKIVLPAQARRSFRSWSLLSILPLQFRHPGRPWSFECFNLHAVGRSASEAGCRSLERQIQHDPNGRDNLIGTSLAEIEFLVSSLAARPHLTHAVTLRHFT